MQRGSLSRSASIFLALMAYCVGVKLLLTLMPDVFRSPAQAAVFRWPFLLLWTVLGLAGVWLSSRTGFPAPGEGAMGDKRAFWIGTGLGLALGLCAIVTDKWTGWTSFVAARMGLPSIHISFPASLLIYPGGAVIVEILYRLFPIPFLLFLLGPVLRREGRQEIAFWVLALLLSLAEPIGDFGLRPLGAGVVAAVFLQDYALNLSQAWLFRKAGFLSAIWLRVVFYLVWHVAWGRTA